MKHSHFITGLFFSVFFLTSCATLFGDTSQIITIESEPSGATIYLNGESVGKTPLRHKVKRETFRTLEVTVRKKGYESEDFLLSKTLQPATLFNFGFISTTFGGSSWLTDALSGALVEYSPNSYFIELSPKTAGKAVGDRVTTFLVTHRQALVIEAARHQNDGPFTRAAQSFFQNSGPLSNAGAINKSIEFQFANAVLELDREFPGQTATVTWARKVKRLLESDYSDSDPKKQMQL